MQANPSKSVILVENPLTGSAAFGKARGLAPVGGVDRLATPEVIRKKWPGLWDKAQKIVLVRPPADRFASATTRAMTAPDSEVKNYPEAFRKLLSSLRATRMTPEERGMEFLKAMVGGMNLPRFFAPQCEWLRSRFSLVLSTADIPAFFNAEGRVTCTPTNLFAADPEKRMWRGTAYGEENGKLLVEFYAKDFELFDRLMVWGPDPSKVRLVTGYCAACTAKRKAASGSNLIDPAREDLTERTKVAEPEKSDAPESMTTAEKKLT